MKKKLLNPLADPIFKHVFGESEDLIISLINSILQLESPVNSIAFLGNELLPKNTENKLSVVDVRCQDGLGRHFIVEMQINHHSNFLDRVYYNATKVYSSQLEKGELYKSLQPVYAISILDGQTEPDSESWIQYYTSTNQGNGRNLEKGIHLVVLELSKCRKRTNFDITNSLDNWITYFINPEKFLKMERVTLANLPEIWKAIDKLDTRNYTPGQMRTYEQYLDSIRLQIDIEETLIANSLEKGLKEGIEKGREEGRKHGMKEGLEQGIQRGIEQGIKEGIQQGIEEGIQQGIEQGRELGIKEGVEEGKKNMLELMPQILSELKKGTNSIEQLSVLFKIPATELIELSNFFK